MDRIRRAVEKRRVEDDSDLDEFAYFAREYPRHYRYYLDCAAYRLESIFHRYVHLHEEAAKMLDTSSDTFFGGAFGNELTWQCQWDFDSYLAAVNSSLELLARIIGPAYPNQTPLSFNKICKKVTDGPAKVLAVARERWVLRLKAYRDCVAHFAPISNWPMAMLDPFSNGWEMRIPIPANPSVREPEFFRRSRRCEILRYCITVYRHMEALDKKVAVCLWSLFRNSAYPRRTTKLFGVN